MATAVGEQTSGHASLFETVSETTTALPLKVCGTVPDYVRGSLYRNGPGKYELKHEDGQYTPIAHWFDGLSMLHRFHIDGEKNTISYNSRLNDSSSSRAAGSVSKKSFNMGITFGVQDPCKSIFGKLFSMFLPVSKDPQGGKIQANVGVTVEHVPGRGLMSRSDVNMMYKFDETTLEVSEFLNWNAIEISSKHENGRKSSQVVGNMTAAHGQYDVSTGEYFNYVHKLGPSPATYKVFCVSNTGKLEVLAEIQDEPSYIHSFALTENYLILIVFPERVNGLKVLFEKSIMGGMSFDEHADTKFHVISRKQRKLVATYSAEAFWCFHTVNSFEDPSTGDIQIDLCRYANGDLISQLYVKNLRSQDYSFFDGALLYRYVLSSAGLAGSQEGNSQLKAVGKVLSDKTVELPRFNELRHLKPYRYVYGPKLGRDSVSGAQVEGRLVKIDTQTGAVLSWVQARGHCSEAIFVPDPNGFEEDDGCLLSIVFDADAQSSFLLILDASTMRELARASCPVVPAGFHGEYLGR